MPRWMRSDPNVAKLGVPVKSTGAVFQKKISNLEVKSNTDKVKTGSFAEGNIEFWSSNYAQQNAAGIPELRSRPSTSVTGEPATTPATARCRSTTSPRSRPFSPTTTSRPEPLPTSASATSRQPAGLDLLEIAAELQRRLALCPRRHGVG